MEEPKKLLITEQLKLKGDLTTSLSIDLSTLFSGKIKTKKELLCASNSEFQGSIRSQTLQIKPGAKVNADVQVGTLIPFWLKSLFSFKTIVPSDE